MLISIDIVNTIGITAYALFLFLLLWLAQIPDAGKTGKYWLLAVLSILLARINLQVLPSFIGPVHTQTLYAVLLVFEKYFLLMGLLGYFNRVETAALKSKLLWLAVLIAVIASLLNSALVLRTEFASFFALSQALAMVAIAYLVLKHCTKAHKPIMQFAGVIFIFYAFHWLTFPIALRIPEWFSLGFIIGNVLNMVTYLFYVYLILYAFQTRLVKSESSARELASKAMAANQAKSEFLANMSHEIRTPMNGVLGMLSLLKRSELNDKQKRQVTIASDSSEALMSIINDILDFSKIEAGKLEIDLTECDLITEIQSIAAPAEVQAESKGLQFTLDLSGLHHETVYIDKLRLRQVLSNLLNNAMKFTDTGSVTLSASISTIAANDETKESSKLLACAVRDTGIGIEAEKLDLLFDAFQQADGSTTREYGGTGLGLTICKRLCELMGGAINVESEVGIGSEFSFKLPLPDRPNHPNHP